MKEVTIIRNRKSKTFIFNKNTFLKFLDEKEYFRSEELAKQVVKEVWALEKGESFKTMGYMFTTENYIND
jgi:hypothetical protein